MTSVTLRTRAGSRTFHSRLHRETVLFFSLLRHIQRSTLMMQPPPSAGMSQKPFVIPLSHFVFFFPRRVWFSHVASFLLQQFFACKYIACNVVFKCALKFSSFRTLHSFFVTLRSRTRLLLFQNVKYARVDTRRYIILRIARRRDQKTKRPHTDKKTGRELYFAVYAFYLLNIG